MVAYGEPNVTTGIRFRYTGQQLIEELGLYYYEARFYSPRPGRFLQTDPAGYRDEQNLYTYVGGDSVNKLDPSGLAGATRGVASIRANNISYLNDIVALVAPRIDLMTDVCSGCSSSDFRGVNFVVPVVNNHTRGDGVYATNYSGSNAAVVSPDFFQ